MNAVITRLMAIMLPALLLSTPAAASDLYRVELLLFERKGVPPEDVAHHLLPSLPNNGMPFWVETDWAPESGEAPEGDGDDSLERPEIISLPQSDLRLSNIANALESDEQYEVLAFTGWQNPFPRGYRTVPLTVDLRTGDEQERVIRGTLDIERRRYLHVNADLYQLSQVAPALDVAPIWQTGDLNWRADILANIRHEQVGVDAPAFPLMAPVSQTPRWKIDTWLREVRRMRSQEVHYMDAPSFGLVVYFHPIDDPEDD